MKRWDLVLVAALVCVVVAAWGVDWRLGLFAVSAGLAVVWWLLDPVEEG